MPSRLRTRGQYRLELDVLEEGHDQWLELDDPVVISPSQHWRFNMQLTRFRQSLRGNELLAELLVRSDSRVVRSRAIYLGVY